MKERKIDYDAIIIGAGIGGIVCGCYLAKAGFKTLIVEKNHQPGGYCTSFKRKGFIFDACAHSLGGLRGGGNLNIVLSQLGIDVKNNFSRHDPSDVLIYNDMKISFWNDINKTIVDFQKYFPKEKQNIANFFEFIQGGQALINLRNKSFENVLCRFFNDKLLKAFISLPVLGNAGLPSSLISAFTAIALYQEFLLDGGYYPHGHMQSFSDLLLAKYNELGGKILLNTNILSIEMIKGVASGIIDSKNKSITSESIVSNIDARQTFLDLIGCESLADDFVKKLDKMTPSLSMLILYLGLSKDFLSLPEEGTNYWILPHNDVEKMYSFARKNIVKELKWFLVRLQPDRRSLLMMVNAPFLNKEFWVKEKEKLMNVYIELISKVIPDVNKYIEYKDMATPETLFKWTGNYNGAAYGWEKTRSQFLDPDFFIVSKTKNLYLCGHWTSLAQGIAGVAYLGKETAKMIINKKGKK